MPDHRTKRQKIEALRDKATTPGEREAAQAALDRYDAAHPRPQQAAPTGDHGRWTDPLFRRTYSNYFDAINWDDIYRPPTGPQARPAGRQAGQGFYCKHGFWHVEAGERCPDCRLDEQLAQQREAIRKHRESLRQRGFIMPDEPGFESSFTKEAADFQEVVREARDYATGARTAPSFNRASETIGRVFQDYMDGKITINELRRQINEED